MALPFSFSAVYPTSLTAPWVIAMDDPCSWLLTINPKRGNRQRRKGVERPQDLRLAALAGKRALTPPNQ
jgi:hypothetical protein